MEGKKKKKKKQDETGHFSNGIQCAGIPVSPLSLYSVSDVALPNSILI